jgi:hypothetical protein
MRTSNNNEHTSSSLGKRNFNEYSKNQPSVKDKWQNNKSSGKKVPGVSYTTQGPPLQMIDEAESLQNL